MRWVKGVFVVGIFYRMDSTKMNYFPNIARIIWKEKMHSHFEMCVNEHWGFINRVAYKSSPLRKKMSDVSDISRWYYNKVRYWSRPITSLMSARQPLSILGHLVHSKWVCTMNDVSKWNGGMRVKEICVGTPLIRRQKDPPIPTRSKRDWTSFSSLC